MSAARWFAAWCMVVLGCGLTSAWARESLIQCHGMRDLAFVAHQDDDLLFMNPDISATIDAGGCVQIVYLTAAERGEGEQYMMGRARGVRAAYAYQADKPDNWIEDIAMFDERPLVRFVLKANRRVSMVHMRLKDPWLGKGWGSLTPLSRAESVPGATAQSLGPYVETYTREDLVATIADIIKAYQPTVVRHMDASITIPYTKLCWRCPGHDHPDHIASARLVRDAIKIEPGTYAEVGYVDYPTQERPINLTADEIARKTKAFRHYAWDDYRYCPNGPVTCKEPAGTAASWVGRTYYVIRRNAAPAVAANPAGGYFLFAVGEANSAANVRASRDKHWSPLGGRIAGHVAAFNRGNGVAGVLARDATGHLWFKTQAGGRLWPAWQSINGPSVISVPLVTRNADGRMALLALGNDGLFHYGAPQSIRPDASWEWSALPELARFLPDVAVALDADGRLTAFAANREGGLWTSSQSEPGVGAWTPWRQIGGVTTSGGLAALRNGQGLIELYARDKKTGHMLKISQSQHAAANNQWETAADMGFSYVGHPAIGLDGQGRAVVAALDHADGSIWLIDASGLVTLGGNVESAPGLLTLNRSLYVFARSNEIAQTYRLWTRVKGHWQRPQRLSAPPAFGGESFVHTRVNHAPATIMAAKP
ncbi:MAG: PIG-L family deacetylase [Candidimonas sp.]|nr:MAG: PIG-L family deacetylase [Candidimonas sp.]TAM26158.1 MAG: PIG-L family deacetylase [Candidimonas sp.]TAM81335.1 MAG: PIG-L family deacetylase [Candidimonas sp.]